ncbi:PREDICTED: uncharacterized protein LOC108557757 [Nicrophorus vespilloides]|uniref:Uncharacterized protein LOC108557757 n=1 Tax=Nicrophorus vespilloides TaxID=110193 RepID=A0ABM1M5P8_NICVS|nr:PREDICTED: uncharacterized protein LOC108557757 [Nicrophorus vespilloides]
MIEKTDDERDVEAIAKFHALFLDLIETFNCIQGWHFFYTMIICILFTLIIVQDMLEPDFVWDTQVFLLYISWFAFVYAQGVFVATMCEQVSEEGKKTITISYKALNKYSNVPALREKLFILAQRDVRSSQPPVSSTSIFRCSSPSST